jgi:dipeptidyl aminopeptidase/acylaminoacyl peptidase
MTRISSPRAEPHLPGSEVAWPSPDGRSVAIVTSRGILASDLIESRILVFNLGAIRRALAHPGNSMPQPRVIASVQSRPTAIETDAYAPVIKDVRWSRDSSTLYFRAVNLLGDYQLCTVKRDGSGFKKLTPEKRSVDRFDIEGDTLVYNASDPEPRLIAAGERINRDALNITDARIQDVLFPNDVTAHADKLFRLYTLKLHSHQSIPHQVPRYSLEEIPYLTALYPFRVSPDVTQLVKLEPPPSVPDAWSGYAPTEGLEHLRLTQGGDPRLLRSDNVLRPLQYALIDLRTGQRVPLLDAPNARSLGYGYDVNRVAWSSDATRVLITNTFLPISGRGGSTASSPCAVASVDLPSRKVRCLEFETDPLNPDAPHVHDVAFTGDSDEALVLLKDGPRKQIIRRYRLHGDVWSLASTESLAHPVQTADELALAPSWDVHGLTVYVAQSLNDPPALWATDADGHKRKIWDPNPQFYGIEFGQAEPYRWRDAADRDWSGILVKPIHFVEGRRYPLVIQMYNYVDGEFLTDGLYPTAFAARELASVGFMVLQIRKRRDTISEDDATIHLEGYRSAIQSLSQKGIIDPAKVGVVGFSWTCWYVAHAIVSDPTLFAAATIADGLDNSYMQYKLFTVGDYILEQQMSKIRNGPPFGVGLEHWVNTAPGFHADRVETPVRIEAIGHSSVLQEWELYSSLRLLNKPVDLIYFPDGSHIHELPLERLESQQGNVDWMRFWLKGEEDPDPAKRAQYRRWEQMREEKHGAAGHKAMAAP